LWRMGYHFKGGSGLYELYAKEEEVVSYK
jgi:hypothetical protein